MTRARLPEHPYRKYATSQLRNGIIGLVLAGGLTLFAVLNFPPAAVPCGLLVVLSGMLARLASRNRREVDALVLNNHADDLVARPMLAALHSDLLRPGLIAQRAFALAALGQEERVEEELESLASAHPGYAYLTRSLFRVRLVTALRGSDLVRATEIAHGRTPALPLSWRDEVLADLVVALDGNDPGERARLRHELAADIELAHWITFIAPDAHARIAGMMPACPGS